MAHLIVRGGTIGTSTGFYPAGVHEIEDEEKLAELELATSDLPWATVEREYVEPLQLGTGEQEAQPALPTMGQGLIAETGNDRTEKSAASKIEDALIPEPEKPTPGFQCPHCDKNLRNEGARISHMKSRHPDLVEEFMAERRAAKEAGEHGWGENAG